MDKKLLKYCKKLSETNRVGSIYKDLVNIFDVFGMLYEMAFCFNILFHYTKDCKYLLFAGDIFTNILMNPSLGFSMYDMYFQKINPQLFTRYKYSLNKMGYDDIEPIFYNIDYSSPIVKLTDRYSAIVYIINCFYENKKFEFVISAIEYLKKLKEKIELYVKNNDKIEYPYENVIDEANKYLSDRLSTDEDNIDINKLVLELYPQNRQAKINIINQYVKDKKYEDALNMYNNTLSSNNTNSITDMLWDMSQIYAENNMIYRSVKYQQYAAEYELTQGDI